MADAPLQEGLAAFGIELGSPGMDGGRWLYHGPGRDEPLAFLAPGEQRGLLALLHRVRSEAPVVGDGWRETFTALADELDRAAADRQAWADHPGIGGDKPRSASHLRGKRYGYSHAAQLIRAALEAPAPLVGGWKPVPTEPTEEMIRALDAGLHGEWPNARKMALAAWAAMLAASPLPTGGGGEGKQGLTASGDESAAQRNPQPLRPEGPRSAGQEDALRWFLRILDKAGGRSNANDQPYNWINAFCDDYDPTDTFNLAEKRGLTRVLHNSSFDESVVDLTDAGRAFLDAEHSPPEPAARSDSDGSDHKSSPQVTDGELVEQVATWAPVLRDWASQIDADATPSQVGPSGDELRAIASALDGGPITAAQTSPTIARAEAAEQRVKVLEGVLRAVSDMLFARPDMVAQLRPLMGPAEHAVFEQARAALATTDQERR